MSHRLALWSEGHSDGSILCSPKLSSVQGRLKQIEVSPPALEYSLTSRYPGVNWDGLGSNGSLFVNWKENHKVDGV